MTDFWRAYDAVRVSVCMSIPRAERDSKVCRLHTRVTALACARWTRRDAERLAKRLLEYRPELLTFAEFAGVPPTDNAAEREIGGETPPRLDRHFPGSPVPPDPR
ncbi:MAG: hypothetical protein ACRC7O_08100 [Fimbriiglobus sp.]